VLAFAEDLVLVAGNQSLSVAEWVNQGSPIKSRFLQFAKFPADPHRRILQVLPKSSFKHLILKTPLWQGAMSTNLKSPLEGLRNTKCKKGTLAIGPPIPYVPLPDLLKKWETGQIKVKLPNGTKFQMSTYGTRNNMEYLVHVIAVMRLIKQKGTAAEVKEPFAALVDIRKEMSPLFNFSDNKIASKKQEQKTSLMSSRKPSRPRRTSLLRRPRRHTSCSVASLSARRKKNGIGLLTRCTPRIRGLV
jgi:hypothetical protein